MTQTNSSDCLSFNWVTNAVGFRHSNVDVDKLLSLHPRNHWPIFCLQVWAVRSRSVDTRRQLRHGPQRPGHSSSSSPPLYRPPLATGTPPTAPQSSSPLPESHELDPGSPGPGPPPLPCPRGARRQPASATYKLWCQLRLLFITSPLSWTHFRYRFAEIKHDPDFRPVIGRDFDQSRT